MFEHVLLFRNSQINCPINWKWMKEKKKIFCFLLHICSCAIRKLNYYLFPLRSDQKKKKKKYTPKSDVRKEMNKRPFGPLKRWSRLKTLNRIDWRRKSTKKKKTINSLQMKRKKAVRHRYCHHQAHFITEGARNTERTKKNPYGWHA